MLIQYAPVDSPLILKDGKGARWTVTDYLLSDVYTALTGKAHPSRPKSAQQQEKSAKRERAEREVKRKFAARNRAMAAAQQPPTTRAR